MALILPPITEKERIRLTGGYSTYDYLIIRNYRYWRLYLFKDQTYLYRCYVWLTDGHTDLQQRPDLKSWHAKELDCIVRDVHEALTLLSQPDMVNEFYGGNEYRHHRGHAHVHLIPRYFTPPVFDGEEFLDKRFGSNYSPYKKRKFPKKTLLRIRDSFKEALAQVRYIP